MNEEKASLKPLPPLFDIDRILHYMNDVSLVLTPNNRLRHKILEAWGQYQQQQGYKSWLAPNVYSLEQWINQQWETLQTQAYPDTEKVVINNEQQRIIWENITRDCGLMQTERIANDALAAYRLLEQWNLSINAELKRQLNPTFIQWSQQYQQQLAQLQMITPETRYRIITQALSDNVVARWQSVYLLAFDDILPAINALLNQATDNIETIDFSQKQQSETLVQRVECDNTIEEIRAAARWAHQLLQEEDATQLRIGIIIPTLISQRDQVLSIFAAELEPQYYHNDTEAYTLPFNISAGTPLAETPFIAATLQLLLLQHSQWDSECICQCLLSPFWGKYSEEIHARSSLVKKLRSLCRLTISATTVRELADEILYPYFALPRHKNSSISPTNQLPSAWVTHFLDQLEQLQWPGERTPNSHEYQQTQLWYQLLEKFSQLDTVLGKISQNTAINNLRVMAQQLPFQAKVDDSPIQVLGILEGTGLTFTHCWIMGMDQQSWPPTAKPNPVLPIDLQRKYNMPHSSSLRELAYAQSLTENYRHCASHIIFSSAVFNEDNEQVLEASLLIKDIPVVDVDSETQVSNTLNDWQIQLKNSQQLDLIDCQKAPKYNDPHLSGGTGLLKAQSHNPFDAFIRYRVNAKPYETASNGFSTIEKGNIMHRSLAYIWRKLRTQEALLNSDQQQLYALINEATHLSITHIQKKRPQELSLTLCTIESERQQYIIQQWLEFEKCRPTFSVVAIEEAQKIIFNNNTLDIRIDRVDQLADGSFLIIDYKTATSSTNHWQGERLRDPQLPLYALTYNGDVSGISFATINVEEQKFYGNSRNDEQQKQGIKATDWDTIQQHWQRLLIQLMEEFQQGHCVIDYIDNEVAAHTKDYWAINRYYETRTLNHFIETYIKRTSR